MYGQPNTRTGSHNAQIKVR